MLTKRLCHIVLSLLLAAGPSATALARTAPPPALRDAGVISFCTELGQPPAAYIGADGATPEGFEVDIMRAIGDELGLRTNITNYKFAGILVALDSGKCDAVMSSTTVTPERLARYRFVEYMQGTSGLLVPEGNPLKLHTYEDMSGRRVAVLLGSSNERRLKDASDRVVKRGMKPIDIAGYTSNVVAFKELELGRVDAFATGTLTLSYFIANAGGRFEIGGTPVPPTPMGIMLPRAQPAKAEAVRQAWSAILKNGTVARIVRKWGAAEGGALCDGVCIVKDRSGVPGPAAGPPPMSSQGGDAAVGFDINFFLSMVVSPSAALIKGLGITIVAAVLSMAFGMLLGGGMAICGISRFPAFRLFNQVYVVFFRGTPALVQLVLIYFGVPALIGIDLFPSTIDVLGLGVSGALVAGILSFSLHEAAYMSEIFRAGIQSIDIGQTEAAKSLGMPPALTLRRIIIPQALRVIVPPLGNQFNIMLKSTSLLSVIAVPELFHVADAIQSATYRSFEVYLGISIYYLALTGLWTFAQQRIEKRMREGRVRPAEVHAASSGPAASVLS